MFGQVGFFNKFAGKDYEDKRPLATVTVAEAKRLLGVIDRRLATRAWIMGDAYTIADIAIFSVGQHSEHVLPGRVISWASRTSPT